MEKIPTLEQKKTYLYHMVPEDMQGDTIHPLNVLKDKIPELYVAKSEKYKDRPSLMKGFIPQLQCLWNDVLHMSAVNPEDVKRALIDAGFQPKEMKFYQIDPNLLDPKQTIIYLYKDSMEGIGIQSGGFTDFSPDQLEEHAIVSQLTKDYYKESFDKGKKPMIFAGIPHVLHKGSIDISDLPVITV